MKELSIEEKELLVKDLSSRLPYKVICRCYHEEFTADDEEPFALVYDERLSMENGSFIGSFNYKIDKIRPYYRPMSSMTKEERHELQDILGRDCEISDGAINIIESSRKSFSFLELQAVFDWFNKKMFDYQGLIPMGLALVAPKGMYK
jgi:hypothetical protein